MPTLSVNTLKSHISERGGLARQNRYLVELPALMGNTILNGNLATDLTTNVQRQQARMDQFNLAESGNGSFYGMSLMCRSTNMPGKQILSLDRRVGLTYNKVAYGYASEDVSMTFQLTEGYSIKDYFEGWQQMAVVSKGTSNAHYPRYLDEYARDVTVSQLGMDGEVKYAVKLIKAYPTTVSAIQFNDASGEPTELSVQLSYRRWTVEGYDYVLDQEREF